MLVNKIIKKEVLIRSINNKDNYSSFINTFNIHNYIHNKISFNNIFEYNLLHNIFNPFIYSKKWVFNNVYILYINLIKELNLYPQKIDV